MIKVKNDLSGQKFGRLTVIKQIEDYIESNGKHRANWFCVCDCGNEVNVIGINLTRTREPTRSCGCLKFSDKQDNIYDLSGDYGIGYAINTNNKFYFDLEDYDKIKEYRWYETVDMKNNYHCLKAQDKQNNTIIKMHKLITNYDIVDHINRNPMDNRQSNLREATINKNNWNKSIQKNNTSGVTGVYWCKQNQKWYALIVCDKKIHYLGYFINKEDAVKTRLKAEVKYFGEFAPQQHLFEEYGINTIHND